MMMDFLNHYQKFRSYAFFHLIVQPTTGYDQLKKLRPNGVENGFPSRHLCAPDSKLLVYS
jgi:hypothetical protein